MGRSYKILTGLAVAVIVVAGMAGFWWYSQKGGGPDLDGRWKLEGSGDGCFTTVRFAANPLSNGGGVSLETTNGNVVQMYYGTFTQHANEATVELNNPPVDPFVMTAEAQEDALKLVYAWEGKDYACTYIQQQ
ncbi:hypothetical protein PA598K_04506 [Paenibacillus sp. 598K]|uniref:hypothetical protein n=1 Tax=Paenibacillus sp. 598K TaxID=1117987 RepID=UPI000FF9605E|nr:hypothetical protein [Paenibacillus sp. 598K]GBF76065.1 hypothetical protein PA598K_04506 [Paenibacillus sp. 598K]